LVITMRIALRTLACAALLAAVGCSSRASADAPHASAELSSENMGTSDSVTLSVSVDGAAAAPTIPSIPGLHIRASGEQSQMTVTNGAMQRSTTYLYDVQADEPGDYVIAGIRAGRQALPPLTLHVSAGSSSAAIGTGSSSAAISGSQSPAPDAGPELASMRLHVDKQRLYAGEAAPFTIHAYFRGGTAVSLNGRPQFSSDAFIVSGLDAQPKQAQTNIGGVPYLAVTWHGVLSAVKAGDYPLDVKLPVSLQYRDLRPAARRPASAAPSSRLRDLFGNTPGFDSLLDDPFFHSMFDEPLFNDMFDTGQVVDKDLTLRGRAGTAHVSPLPAAGRPRDFSGAIGQFQLQTRASETNLRQGEPSELHITLRGSGNFGQFSAPHLASDARWNAYDPTSRFTASDSVGLKGTTEYTQALTPERSGALQIPGVSFSYFDPNTQRYVALAAPAIPVHVAPSGAIDTASATTARAPAPARPAPNEISVRSLTRAGVPSWLLPLTAAVVLLATLVCGVALWLRSPRRERQRLRVQSKRRLSRKRRAMQRAARAGDEEGYVRSSKRAIAQRLAEAWSLEPEAITLHELDRRWPTAPASIREVFERADEAEYGGRARQHAPLAPSELVASARQLDKQIKHLEVPT
jgi:hypothetical protein